jgi:steroid 5-alpha reductase family enzyme
MGRDEVIFVLGIVVLAAAMLLSGHAFLPGLAAGVVAFTLLWLVSLALRNASIVDIAWGPGFVIVGAAYLALAQSTTARGLLVMALVTVWALRLAIYIGRRNIGHGEDHRYAKWRSEAGGSFWWRSYFKVFLLQAVVLWVVSSPLLLATLPGGASALGPLDVIGLTLWLVGFLFEAVSDWQMSRFKADPANKGQVMSSGLWGLSRHPNYFGEAVLWWGIGLLALPTGGWLALGGPALMMFTLMRVSGVTLLDRAMVERRPGYAEYIRSTPAFFPVRIGRRTAEA